MPALTSKICKHIPVIRMVKLRTPREEMEGELDPRIYARYLPYTP
jgi:hypothetical protein